MEGGEGEETADEMEVEVTEEEEMEGGDEEGEVEKGEVEKEGGGEKEKKKPGRNAGKNGSNTVTYVRHWIPSLRPCLLYPRKDSSAAWSAQRHLAAK